MPLYDYDCAACGTRFEVIHGVHAEGPSACPSCGEGPVRKAFAAPAVHFKGSGWAKKERRATATAASAAKAGDTAGGSDSAGSDKASGPGDGSKSSTGADAPPAAAPSTAGTASD